MLLACMVIGKPGRSNCSSSDGFVVSIRNVALVIVVVYLVVAVAIVVI